jgi:antigen flippase
VSEGRAADRGAPRRAARRAGSWAPWHAILDGAPGTATRLGVLRARLSRPGIGRSIAQTAGFSIAATVAGSLSGVLIARVTGPTMRGEYTAVTSWLGITTMLCELGQTLSLCYFVAHDPWQARAYTATSRTMMLVGGMLGTMGGLILAPVLAHGHPGLTMAYRIAFLGVFISCAADGCMFALMGSALTLWNKARISQPLVAFAAIIVLWRVRQLTLDTALVVLLGSLLVQFAWSYWGCRRAGLAPGRLARGLVRPLAGYGLAQMASSAPYSANAYLDQLVLSVTVPPADLGYYSIAVSMTLLPIPFVSAIGLVLLPTLAAENAVTARTRRLQRTAVLVSLGAATAILLPLAFAAPYLIPLIFGPAYSKAVPLLWILTPGGIFLSCGQVAANLLRGVKRQLVVARAEGMALVFTLTLLAALLPVIGVTGAAIASTVPYGVSLVLMLRALRRMPNN